MKAVAGKGATTQIANFYLRLTVNKIGFYVLPYESFSWFRLHFVLGYALPSYLF